ncbi:hypothetical protein QBC35DRAFT_473461 [Podospora australis]|uniref:Uncharacterized protein n=1 Tax=Podospora australis TaxID=1536484 RepID=A0AAN7AK96_9PEZI|nr:hypothetical protein QBC35DRAFT_473461 [Podospora australis]
MLQSTVTTLLLLSFSALAIAAFIQDPSRKHGPLPNDPRPAPDAEAKAAGIVATTIVIEDSARLRAPKVPDGVHNLQPATFTTTVANGAPVRGVPDITVQNWSDNRSCQGESKPQVYANGLCGVIPGLSIKVDVIPVGCKTLIYTFTDCGGESQELVAGQCYDAYRFISVQTTCP